MEEKDAGLEQEEEEGKWDSSTKKQRPRGSSNTNSKLSSVVMSKIKMDRRLRATRDSTHMRQEVSRNECPDWKEELFRAICSDDSKHVTDIVREQMHGTRFDIYSFWRVVE